MNHFHVIAEREMPRLFNMTSAFLHFAVDASCLYILLLSVLRIPGNQIHFTLNLSFMTSIYVSFPEQWQFNEADYIHSLQSLQQLRNRLHVFARHLIRQIPGDGRFRYFPMSYHFTAFSLAHIVDRHHHSIDKFPGRSKFTITIPEITLLVKEAFFAEQQPIQKAFIYRRTLSAGRIIGRDQKGNPCRNITVITDHEGNIKSAYPTC